MIVIVVAAFVSGVVTFLAAAPHSLALALSAAPLVGSTCALLAALLNAGQTGRREPAGTEIDEAVASLRDIAARARRDAPTEARSSHHGAAYARRADPI